ncbi:MAG: hypothetical protein C6W57_07185 [Caldibacillus debilis]|uniref:DUF5694 domain-containing protein n=1 Tax=Caldibacillus debilis TaxID=301148 RepID=UPI000E3B40F6|nr:DUF5694 domain-containing protein [Caldibacillus debilis]REJ17331.1 MAG: hypothetical protein C6W57_07185 [Caldibacillus debilis]
MAKPAILLLGTAHLENPDNGVLLNPVTDGILSPKRQAEIIEVAKSLKKFQPTQIAVEVLKRLNKEYRSYLNGNFQLTANEIHQIGFRLAEDMKIERLHASDWNEKLGKHPRCGILGGEKRFADFC